MTLFSQFELSRFWGILTMKVNGQWVPCVGNYPQSFILILLKLTDVLMMLRRYACALDIILGLIFDTFCNLNLVVFQVF